MKARLLKLSAVVLCVILASMSLTSCGVFLDEENNFVGLNNIIELIYGDEDEELVDTGIVPESDEFGADYEE